MTTQIPEVDQYLENLAPDRRTALTQLRSLVHDAVPDAVETLKYKMPTYAYGDHVLCAFASQKRYVSLYVDVELLEKHRQELEHLDLGKSCIRFKRIEQLPLDVVRTILSETVAKLSSE